MRHSYSVYGLGHNDRIIFYLLQRNYNVNNLFDLFKIRFLYLSSLIESKSVILLENFYIWTRVQVENFFFYLKSNQAKANAIIKQAVLICPYRNVKYFSQSILITDRTKLKLSAKKTERRRCKILTLPTKNRLKQ